MSQIWTIDDIDINTTSPVQAWPKAIDTLNALRTAFSGPSRPTDIATGQVWINTAYDTDLWALYRVADAADPAKDALLYLVKPSTGQVMTQGVGVSTTIDLTTDADYTLTAAENAYGRVVITDTGAVLTAARIITISSTPRLFIAHNDTAHSLTFKPSAGTGISVDSGNSMLLVCDGANVHEGHTSASGSGLSFFTEQRDTTAGINDTIPVHSFEVLGAETDIDVALKPKGTGALTAQVPDGAQAGGNKRGIYAVDLQRDRYYADSVASGESSVVAGGFNNKASGYLASVLGGSNNQATGNYSAILGSDSNYAIGAFSVCVGFNHVVNGQNGVAVGYANTVDGRNAIAIGTDAAKATADDSIAMGSTSDTRTTKGKLAFASGRFGANYGSAQMGLSMLFKTTSDATAAILNSQSENGVPDATNVPVLPDDHAYIIKASVIARDAATGDAAIWEIAGGARRGAGVSTVVLLGTPAKTIVAADPATVAWDCNLIVNTTRGSAEIEVTGESGKTIHWVCKFDTVEVG